MSDENSAVENKHLKEMLEYETQIFSDIVQTDGLVVCAKGLNLDIVILNILNVYENYFDEGNLVLMLNCSESEERFYIKNINKEHIYVTSNYVNTQQREKIYLQGGIHIASSQILAYDILKKRIPIDKILGIIVLRAHKVIESCQEAFVLRLYRQNNKEGFIKAFSNSVQSFTCGFGHVEQIMKTLFVKNLYIWPRFHKLIIQDLKKYEPIVIELHVPISKKMENLQTCLLNLMELTIKELKHINKAVELQEITVENCLIKKFHKILQLQLDCIWHQLSSKSKQLVADLHTLRHLICLMLYTDPITFYSTLSSYRSMEYVQKAMWIFLQPADLLFTNANSLIYGKDKELNPEFCPKWKPLRDLLQVEIPSEISKHNITDAKILILCQDKKTCFQLNHLLAHGPNNYLFLMAIKHKVHFKSVNKIFESCQASLSQANTTQTVNTSKKLKLDNTNDEETNKTNEECAERDVFKSSYMLSISQLPKENKEDIDNEATFIFEECDELENLDISQLTKPTVLLQTFSNQANYVSVEEMLINYKPHYIIMYHSNVTAIRHIELYTARIKCKDSLKVYFLVHNETVEEQSYLTELRREKEAFEHLISTKSTMVIPEDQDGKSETCLSLQRELKVQKSTRQGGQSDQANERQYVIVDLREFRSELPSLIHKRGIDIEPAVITVGDYILTDEICVERKSMSDLIMSLNSGRIFRQCTQMSRYYTKPMLLIEYEQSKVFSRQNNSYMISSDSQNFFIQKKLLLLTMHFPKLKIIWSPSSYASAQLFEELKEGKMQPNVEYANAIGGDENVDVIETKYNTRIYDFIQKMPGISSKNINAFMRKYSNLSEVSSKSEDELKEVLGNSPDAKQLYSSLHEEHDFKEIDKHKLSKSKVQNKFKNILKRDVKK